MMIIIITIIIIIMIIIFIIVCPMLCNAWTEYKFTCVCVCVLAPPSLLGPNACFMYPRPTLLGPGTLWGPGTIRIGSCPI